jgi:hypothetical protein
LIVPALAAVGGKHHRTAGMLARRVFLDSLKMPDFDSVSRRNRNRIVACIIDNDLLANIR